VERPLPCLSRVSTPAVCVAGGHAQGRRGGRAWRATTIAASLVAIHAWVCILRQAHARTHAHARAHMQIQAHLRRHARTCMLTPASLPLPCEVPPAAVTLMSSAAAKLLLPMSCFWLSRIGQISHFSLDPTIDLNSCQFLIYARDLLHCDAIPVADAYRELPQCPACCVACQMHQTNRQTLHSLEQQFLITQSRCCEEQQLEISSNQKLITK
jgi:hypothetical protein